MHTPGPWKAEETQDERGNTELYVNTNTRAICEVLKLNTRFSDNAWNQENAVVRANARLIAKAPEMATLLRQFDINGNTGALNGLRAEARALLREIEEATR